MTHKPENGTDVDLETFFSAARASAVQPGGDLLARIEADALAAQAGITRKGARRSVLRGLLGVLGGWPGMAGLAAAACAGVWIGFAPPDAVDALWPADTSFSALDPASGYDFAMVEG